MGFCRIAAHNRGGYQAQLKLQNNVKQDTGSDRAKSMLRGPWHSKPSRGHNSESKQGETFGTCQALTRRGNVC